MGHARAPLLEPWELVRSPAAGTQLRVPSAAHPASSSYSQGKAARHPGTLPDTMHKLPLAGKYNGTEPGRGKNTLAIISHPKMESQCNCNTCGPGKPPWSHHFAGVPAQFISSFFHLTTKPSPWFWRLPKEVSKTENLTSVFLTAFIQYSNFVVWRKSTTLYFLFHARLTKGEE